MCIDVVPFGESGYVARPYGFNDTFKGALAKEEEMRPGVMYGDTLSNHTELTAVSDAAVASSAVPAASRAAIRLMASSFFARFSTSSERCEEVALFFRSKK